MAEKKIEKCAHPGCNCPASKDAKYCSDYCESIGKQPSIVCNCGHAECAAGEGHNSDTGRGRTQNQKARQQRTGSASALRHPVAGAWLF
jgi:hypothetical protein